MASKKTAQTKELSELKQTIERLREKQDLTYREFNNNEVSTSTAVWLT